MPPATSLASGAANGAATTAPATPAESDDAAKNHEPTASATNFKVSNATQPNRPPASTTAKDTENSGETNSADKRSETANSLAADGDSKTNATVTPQTAAGAAIVGDGICVKHGKSAGKSSCR